jgi:serine/threonine protein phosphatase 1
MVYAMSDLHGRYDLYERMLRRIGFGDGDTLYVLGDYVDRGADGCRIILDVAERKNVVSIMGNHDLMALYLLSRLSRPLKPGEEADLSEVIGAWLMDGGKPTLEAFRRLDEMEKRLVLGTMDGFRNFAEVKAGGREFVLCHGALYGYRPDRPLDDYTLEELVFHRTDYSKPIYKGNKFLITGHTPTAAIDGATAGRIYHKNNHIAIDCGAVFDLGLGCICLDTMEEFYVI